MSTSADKSIAFTVKNDLSEIERLSSLVAGFGQQHRLPSNVTFALNLVLEEIVVNAISYGYDDQAEHGIIIRLSRETDQVSVEVEDDGRPFNPLEAPEVDVNKPLKERTVGGLGIHLVRHLMDDLEYRRVNEKNHLVMRKKVEEVDAASPTE